MRTIRRAALFIQQNVLRKMWEFAIVGFTMSFITAVAATLHARHMAIRLVRKSKSFAKRICRKDGN